MPKMKQSSSAIKRMKEHHFVPRFGAEGEDGIAEKTKAAVARVVRLAFWFGVSAGGTLVFARLTDQPRSLWPWMAVLGGIGGIKAYDMLR